MKENACKYANSRKGRLEFSSSLILELLRSRMAIETHISQLSQQWTTADV